MERLNPGFRKYVPWLAAALVSVGATVWFLAGRWSGGEAGTGVGQRAPDFTLVDLDGRAIRLSDLRGEPVLLNFWATWCPPCRAEMPELARVAGEQQGNVRVVGVNLQGEPGEVRSFAAQAGVHFPILLDRDLAVAHNYLVRAIPTTYFLDRDGVIRDVQVGGMTRQRILQGITRAGGQRRP